MTREYRLCVYHQGQLSSTWTPRDSWGEILNDVRQFHRMRARQYLLPDCTAQVQTRERRSVWWVTPRPGVVVRRFGRKPWQ